MKLSNFHIHTTKETPADAEITSHQLMLRAGMIRKLTGGIYSWTPLGLRVLRRVEQVVREEMNAAGALEMLMPAVQPAELWEESGRWDVFGPQLLKMTDRAGREFCFGPTHEEVVSDFARNEISSYKQLPINVYQIQTKFRDEIRPRFGVMRSREFLMKDAYSFDLSQDAMAASYQLMFDAYTRIFERLGLRFRPVEADSGAIGGSASHEFHVLADSGEDALAVSNGSDYAANVEKAEAVALPAVETNVSSQPAERLDTPNCSTVAQLGELLGCELNVLTKSLVVLDDEDQPVMLVLRGDHQLNEVKAENLPGIKTPLTMAEESAIRAAYGAGPGSLGPVGVSTRVIVDRSAATMPRFVCGANEDGAHLRCAEWKRDVSNFEVADLREVVAGDPSPDGAGELAIVRGIEVGHVFQLGDKYSQALNVNVLDENGKSVALQMGCYGIGISRIVAAAIEQNHDDRGIIWPQSMAPFQLSLIGLNHHKSARVAELANELYNKLTAAGIDVLWDDRKQRPGVMFADQELLGIPHRLVIAERKLDEGMVEYRKRDAADNEDLALDGIVETMLERILGKQ